MTKEAHFNLVSAMYCGSKTSLPGLCAAQPTPAATMGLPDKCLCKPLVKWQGKSRKRNSQSHLQVDNELNLCVLVSYNQLGVGHSKQLVYMISWHWEEDPTRRPTPTARVEIMPLQPKADW